MRIALPDVNVLVALHDPEHPHHQRAQAWFDTEGKHGWATCPLTENGFIRVFTNTKYPNNLQGVSQTSQILENMATTYHATYHFWEDNVSLRDAVLFRPSAIAGYKQITDVYLLGLCQHNAGTLVTLDDKITVAAINNPQPDLLHKI